MEFKRLFTQREAESALPLVRQIVADVLETARRIREAQEGGPDLAGLQAELEEHLLELEEMGCYYKDWNFSVGLVDFPAEIDGETVSAACPGCPPLSHIGHPGGGERPHPGPGQGEARAPCARSVRSVRLRIAVCPRALP